jgi:hypothetical protein
VTTQGQKLTAILADLSDRIATYQAQPNETDQDTTNLQDALSDGAAGVHAAYDSLANLLGANGKGDQATNLRQANSDLDTYLSGVLQDNGITDDTQTLLMKAEAKHGTDEEGLVSDGTGIQGFSFANNIHGTVADYIAWRQTPEAQAEEAAAEAAASGKAPSSASTSSLIDQVTGSSKAATSASNAILNQPKTQQQQDAEKALAVAYSVLGRIDDENTRFQKAQQQKLQNPNAPAGTETIGYTSVGAAVAAAASGTQVTTA